MSLISLLRRRWQLMRAERARGEASRQQVFELLKRIRDNERKRIENIQRIKAQQAVKEHRQQVQKQAYLLWEADGKPEDKDNYYWKLAIDKIRGRNLFFIYRIYYLLEKRILEPANKWISRQAFFTIAAQLAILAAIIAFIGSEETRRNNEVFNAWQTITSANGQTESGGRIEALKFLNSRPLKFPWIGWTEKGWYWDEGEEKCKLKQLWGLRWERQPLAGLSAPNGAYLAKIYLCGAHLIGANLQRADLTEANLQEANLNRVNLQEAALVRANLQGAFLDEAKLKKADLEKASLQEATLVRVNLQGALLYLTNLQEANLWQANLQEANLHRVNLQGANLWEADLQDAFLGEAYLERANLNRANLQGAFLGNPWRVIELNLKQIKSACFWDKAIYKFEWNEEKQIFVAIESDNTNFIEELKNDRASDPEEAPDCSQWEKEN